MTILISKKGHVFLDFLEIDEEKINDYISDAPLTHSLVIAKYKGNFLLMFNKWRKNWELAGGIIDEGETPRECAIRELQEETNQHVSQLNFKGLMKFQLKPDDRLEYGALYSGDIEDLKPFKENEEAEEIHFWDKKSKIGYIDEIDKKLLDYF